MYILRSLVFVLFFTAFAKADMQSVVITGSTAVIEPKSDAATIEEKIKNKVKSWSVTVNKIELNSFWTLTLDYTKSQSDFSQYKIYDYFGTESSLADTLSEDAATVDQIWSAGKSVFELVLASNFGTTPLAKTNYNFLYLYKVDNQNLWGVSLGFQQQKLPLNYYTNPQTNVREARPSVLDSESLKISFEHIFTSNYKNRFELMYGRRLQDRPRSYGLGLRNLLVLNDDFGWRFDGGYLAENEAEVLKTDLGYQKSTWFETKIIHNLSSYWTYGVGYSLEVNQERKPWLGETAQLGNDQILADVKYDQLQYSISVAAAWVKYNTGQSGTNVKGELEWKF